MKRENLNQEEIGKEELEEKLNKLITEQHRKNYKFNVVMMTVICLAPVLNLLFDYFALNRKPTIAGIISVVLVAVVYPLYMIWLKGKTKN